jgi:hypothetical protein
LDGVDAAIAKNSLNSFYICLGMLEDVCKECAGLFTIGGLDILIDEICERRQFRTGSGARSDIDSHRADDEESARQERKPQ